MGDLLTNITGLFGGCSACSCMPNGPKSVPLDPGQQHVENLMDTRYRYPGKVVAAAPSTSAHASTVIRRCSSAPRKAQIVALRQKQQLLRENLAELSEKFDLDLQVPSSHPCSCAPTHFPRGLCAPPFDLAMFSCLCSWPLKCRWTLV